jgi:hypothetical protein
MNPPEVSGGNKAVCAMDVIQCPDGSFVGRIGPKCEFAPCPTGRIHDIPNSY